MPRLYSDVCLLNPEKSVRTQLQFAIMKKRFEEQSKNSSHRLGKCKVSKIYNLGACI